MIEIDFYYSLGSRYAYLASTQIETIEKEYGCQFNWYPINSIKLFEERSDNPFKVEPKSGQYNWDYRKKDANSNETICVSVNRDFSLSSPE